MNAITYDSTNHHPFADLARVIFGLAPAAVLLGLTIAVVLSYFRAWRITRYKRVHRGLLPFHVWTISASYVIILADSVYALIERLHKPINPHTFIVLPGYVLGCAALWTVLRFERLRYQTESGVNMDLDCSDGK